MTPPASRIDHPSVSGFRRTHKEKAMKVRAKFKVLSVQEFPTTNPQDRYAQVMFMPVYNDGPENETWSRATPSGQISMCITNPDAIEAFEIGKSYFVDFTPVD